MIWFWEFQKTFQQKTEQFYAKNQGQQIKNSNYLKYKVENTNWFLHKMDIFYKYQIILQLEE